MRGWLVLILTPNSFWVRLRASRCRRTARASSTRASSNCRSASVISRKSAASPIFQPAACRALRFAASIILSLFTVVCFLAGLDDRIVLLQPLFAPLHDYARYLPCPLGIYLQNEHRIGINPVHDPTVVPGVSHPQ